MAKKTFIVHEGITYYSVVTTAKMLGIRSAKARELIESEGLEWINLRENGEIWIGAESVKSLLRRREFASKKNSN